MIFHNRPITSIVSYSVMNDGFVQDDEFRVIVKHFKNKIIFSKSGDRVEMNANFGIEFRKWKYICIPFSFSLL